MIRPASTCLSLCLLFTALDARAQEPGGPRPADAADPQPDAFPGAKDALDQYLERSLELRFEQGMFSPFEVYQNGTSIDLGFFGGGYESVFAGSPDALEAMSTYQILRAVGLPLWIAGMLTLTVEVVLLLVDALEGTDILMEPGGPKPLFYGLLIGGGVVGVAGGIMIQAAPSYLGDAVLYHNRDLLREIRGQRAELARPATLAFSFSF